MSNIQTFHYDDHQIRTLLIDNQPWFVAIDIASALGYAKPRDAIWRHCDYSVPRGVVDARGQSRETFIINEKDVFALVYKSKMKGIVGFREWILELIESLKKPKEIQVNQELTSSVFTFDGMEIRTLMVEGEPWFVAIDIASALGYAKPRDAIWRHCDYSVPRGVVDARGQMRDTLTIPESDMYSLVMASQLEGAKRFKRWVVEEVLPQLRKTGSYSLQSQFKLPQTYSEALRELADTNDRLIEEKKRTAEQQQVIQVLEPKGELYDKAMSSETLISMKEVADTLAFRGMGRNNLFKYLRDKDILGKDNKPYRRYTEQGWFKVVEKTYLKKGGEQLTFTTYATQKGMDNIYKMLTSDGYTQVSLRLVQGA